MQMAKSQSHRKHFVLEEDGAPGDGHRSKTNIVDECRERHHLPLNHCRGMMRRKSSVVELLNDWNQQSFNNMGEKTPERFRDVQKLEGTTELLATKTPRMHVSEL